MIFLTVPGIDVLGCSGFRVVSRFISAILADLLMRGFAISCLTLSRVALADSFLDFIFTAHLACPRDGFGGLVSFHLLVSVQRMTSL